MSEWVRKKLWVGVAGCFAANLIFAVALTVAVMNGWLAQESVPMWLMHGLAVAAGCILALRDVTSQRLLCALMVCGIYFAALLAASFAWGPLQADGYILRTAFASLVAMAAAALLRPATGKRKKGRGRRKGKKS